MRPVQTRHTTLYDNLPQTKIPPEKILRVNDRVIIQIARDPQLGKPKSLRLSSPLLTPSLLRDCELPVSALTAFAGVWLQNPLPAVTLPYNYHLSDSLHRG